MINNRGGDGGPVPTATFRFAYEMADGRETLNGNPIAKGETVELEIGSRNLLISAGDYSSIYTEETYERVPYLDTTISTRAPAPLINYTFIMPNVDIFFGSNPVPDNDLLE